MPLHLMMIGVFQDVAYLINDKNDVSISYSLFENASDALANRSSGILNNQSGTLVRFERASLITVGPADTARIDLASFSTKFVGGVLTTPVMKFTVEMRKMSRVQLLCHLLTHLQTLYLKV